MALIRSLISRATGFAGSHDGTALVPATSGLRPRVARRRRGVPWLIALASLQAIGAISVIRACSPSRLLDASPLSSSLTGASTTWRIPRYLPEGAGLPPKLRPPQNEAFSFVRRQSLARIVGAAPKTGRLPSHRSKLTTADNFLTIDWAMVTASSSVLAEIHCTPSIFRSGPNERSR